MKKIQFLVIGLVVLGSFLVLAGNAKAYTCSLSFSSPHGSQIYVGDRVTWTLNSSFTGGKSYWFGTKNGVTDVNAVDTTFGNPFSWTTDPYPDAVGNYTRWVQVNDISGNFLCQTNIVSVSVTAPTLSVSISPTTIPLSIQSGASISTYPSGWVGFTISPNQLINWTAQSSVGWLAVSPSGSVYSTGGTSIAVNSQAANLVPGTYTGIVTFSPATGSPNWTPQTVTVTLTVAAATTTTNTLNITSPSAGTILYQGSTYNITWTGNYPSAYSYPVYLVSGSSSLTQSRLLGTAYASQGTFGWTVPSDIIAGSPYQIKFNTGSSDCCNSPSFSIAAAIVTPSANLSLSVTRAGFPITSSPYQAGDSFTLNLTSNQPTKSFVLCSNRGPCTSTLTTNSSGGYAWSGTWINDSSNTGNWEEWVQFGSYSSLPKLSFTVNAVTVVSTTLTPIPIPTLTPTPTPAGFTINSCQEITQSGNYTLSRDITGSPRTYCLNIHDVNNINLDCSGRSIKSDINSFGNLEDSAIRIKNVNNFSVKNCYLSNINISNYFPNPIEIRNSSSGLINNNTFGDSNASKPSYSVVTYSNDINFSDNKFNSSYVEFFNTDNSTVNNNVFNYRLGTVIHGLITFGNSNNNTITNNIIDGGSDGVFANKYGPDDGIILQNESTDNVSGNTIKNVWDAGIETLGIIKNTIINNNSTYNTGIAAIGAWYGNNWQGNTVSNNTGEKTNLLFDFYRAWGLQTGESSFNFENNTFNNNRFINPNSTAIYSARFDLDYRYINYEGSPGIPINAGNTKVGNNKFTNNNFGSSLLAPLFIPISAIVDGSNNTCKPGTDNNYPLTCGRPGGSTPNPTTTQTPGPVDQSRIYSLSEIYDGNIIRGQGDIAVWIVKIVGEKRFKRWLFGPQIFTAYGHLGFHKVKNVSKVTLNNFDTSNLIRKFDVAKVYELTDFVPGVSAARRWIPTVEVFLQRGFDFDSVYIVNQNEFNLYTEGSPLPVTMKRSETKENETKNNLPLTANISDAMLRFLGLTR